MVSWLNNTASDAVGICLGLYIWQRLEKRAKRRRGKR
jgi:hypothetical protein